MTTLYCDACGKQPSPNVNANNATVSVRVGTIEFKVTLTANVDLCHECRNEALCDMMRHLIGTSFDVNLTGTRCSGARTSKEEDSDAS